MPRPVVIYLPRGAATLEQEQELRRRYPGATFTERYEDGAISWAEALKGG